MSETAEIEVRLVDLERVRGAGGIKGLLAVELEIGGIILQLRGAQIRRDQQGWWSVHPPAFRGSDGRWQNAIELPSSVMKAISDLVRDEAREWLATR